MPRFTRDGPFVPDDLVQALEDDRIVIFCGAGISVGAGLPDFRGLVEHCYTELHFDPPPCDSDDWHWLDRLLGGIEAKCSPEELRRVVAARLSQPPTDLTMHKAILRLAQLNRSRGLRLVTTNFDTYFEAAQVDFVFGRDLHSGPVLPIPRNDCSSSWRSIVYLHGRLAPAGEPNDHLVLTSADFGRAYLTDAWGARFVTRLFADFTVVFIGYSLNDPVLRYMTDAFAAEEVIARTSSRRGPAYIFVGHTGQTPPDRQSYADRHLEPIFYNQELKHIRLKETLVAWAAARENYRLNVESIIERSAPSRPQALDPSDVENVLWAIVGRPTDSGHGARAFANLSDAPPIDWLFEIERRERTNLEKWEKARQKARSNEEDTSASPTSHLRLLMPEQGKSDHLSMSQTAIELGRWLLRHLETIDLVDWVIDNMNLNRRLHFYMRIEIRKRLRNGSALAPGFETFWRIVSAEGSWNRSDISNFSSINLIQRLCQTNQLPLLRLELLSALRPYIHLSKSTFRQFQELVRAKGMPTEEVGQSVGTVVSANVRLVAHDRLSVIVQFIDQLPDPNRFLAEFSFPLTNLLQQALDLFAIVNEADANWDRSAIDRPSIQPHAQNSDFRDWNVLFDLLWRAWQYIDKESAEQSRALVQLWRGLPYLTFRRFVIAAVTVSQNFTSREKLEVLLNV